MNWALGALFCVVLVEIARRLPFPAAARSLSHATARALRTAGARHASDHWKQKAMTGYARATLAATLRLAVMLAVLLSLAAALGWMFGGVAPGFTAFLLSWTGGGFTLAMACLYAFIRRGAAGGRI